MEKAYISLLLYHNDVVLYTWQQQYIIWQHIMTTIFVDMTDIITAYIYYIFGWKIVYSITKTLGFWKFGIFGLDILNYLGQNITTYLKHSWFPTYTQGVNFFCSFLQLTLKSN